MQPRFAALLFALGLADLAYVNLGLGPALFASSPDAAPADGDDAPVAVLPEATPPEVLAKQAPPAPDAPAPEAPSTTPPSPTVDAPSTLVENTPPPGDVAPAPNPTAEGRVRDVPLAAPEALPSAEPAPARELHAAPAPETDAPEPAAEHGANRHVLEADLTVAFPDTATAALTPEARDELLTLAARLRQNPHYRLRIVGHADARGTREFNLNLGARRARAVSELLSAAGVSRDQLVLRSRGEDQPRAVGASEEVWAVNRRVEISIASEKE